MTLELAESLVDILHKEDEEAELLIDYSGRGMYGRLTHAIVTSVNISRLFSFVIANAEMLCDAGESRFIAEDLTQDNMGQDYVIY
jgi:hypothetical protein